MLAWAGKGEEKMEKTLSKPELRQYGMDGWEKHFEYITTCIKCDTTFLSNVNGEALCNGEKYKNCPYCTKFYFGGIV